MPDILIRGVDPAVVDRLKRRAELRGTSLQVEAKHALESAAKYSKVEFLGVARQLREETKGASIDTTRLIREARDE